MNRDPFIEVPEIREEERALEELSLLEKNLKCDEVPDHKCKPNCPLCAKFLRRMQAIFGGAL